MMSAFVAREIELISSLWYFKSAELETLKSDTAALIINASQCSNSMATTLAISSAVSTAVVVMPSILGNSEFAIIK